MVKHDYNYEAVSIDEQKLADSKLKLLMKKQRQQVPFDKVKGREDNLIFNINEGYNLDDRDNTFFAKHGVSEIFFNTSPKASTTMTQYG